MFNTDINNTLNIRNLYSSNNLSMLNNFKQMIEDTSTQKFYIGQKDFRDGTYRIKKSGIYKLMENIEFSPNNNTEKSMNCNDFINVLDNFHPKYPEQINDYPSPPYQFGFFAAITIECDNVIIDMNYKKLSQSHTHYFHQRFYSNIELNKSPFITGQGPSNFGEIEFPKNICIKNGILGKSSHHSIHGNGNKNILLENLTITEYEVAGIAINGGENMIFRDIKIKDSSKIVDINFLYSNALYTRRFLYQLIKKNPNAYLNIKGKNKKYVSQILCELQDEMINKVYKFIIKKEQHQSNLFLNKSKLPEGNIYGIVLNTIGVVINDFLKNRNNIVGNYDIVIHDVFFENINSFPREIISLTEKKKLHTGTVGDIIPYLDIIESDSKFYNPNPITNATVILAKYKNIDSEFNISSKSLFIPQFMIDEFFENQNNLIDIKNKYSLKFVNLRDQMNHVMKGNLIIFISGGNNIKIDNIYIENISNEGLRCDCDPDRISDYEFIYYTEDFINYNMTYKNYLGNNISPICIVSSTNTDINNIYCKNIYSKNGRCEGVQIIGESNKINSRNISINNFDYYQDINRLLGYNVGIYNGLLKTESILAQLKQYETITKLELIQIIINSRLELTKIINNINSEIITYQNKKLND